MHAEPKWIESGGGPLIVLAEPLVDMWWGASPMSGDLTDYDRACKVGEVGVITVGSTYGLVLGDEPLPTRVYNHASGCILARWRYAQSDADVDIAMEKALDGLTWRQATTFPTSGVRLMLFDSAYAGDDIPDWSSFSLKESSYIVEIAEYSPDAETALQLIRFR